MLKYLLAVLAIVAVLYLILIQKEESPKMNVSRVSIKGPEIEVELADTPVEITAGLSGRERLDENKGMLFIFGKPGFRNFWMKDMKFPIDIIWIDENKKIIDISENVLPESYPETFSPNEPAKYVIEANAGFSDKNGIGIGDKVEF